MSALLETLDNTPLPEEIKDVIRKYAGPIIWKAYEEHKDDVLLQVKIWFIPVKTIRVNVVEKFLTLLLGPAPIDLVTN